jgi:hypothetical protein
MKSSGKTTNDPSGRVLLTALLALVLAGCAYRLGPTNGERAGARSIQIQPLDNKTIMPRLSEAVTHALRKEMMRDGTYKVDTHGDTDIILTGVIVDYERRPMALQPRDALSPRDYRIVITAQIFARERGAGKILLDRKVQGYSLIRIGPNLVSAEREALPLVAEDLARNATALLVDGTW